MNLNVDWEELANRENNARKKEDHQELSKIAEIIQLHLMDPSLEDQKWLNNGLETPDRKLYIAIMMNKVSNLSEKFFDPLMRAAIYEVNPSTNKLFVLPCIKNFGTRRVNEYLLNVLETGTPFEQAGAVNAMYWAQITLTFKLNKGILSEFSFENATNDSQRKYFALEDIWEKKRIIFLETFVKSKSVDVQRSIIASLNFNIEQYPESLKPLIKEAIKIAISHPDDYIRHRAENKLGERSGLEALPHRK